MNFKDRVLNGLCHVEEVVDPFKRMDRLDYKNIVDNLMGFPLPPEIHTPEVVTTIIIDGITYADEKKFGSGSLLEVNPNGQIYKYADGLGPFTTRFDFSNEHNPFIGKNPLVSLRQAIRYATQQGVSIEEITEVFNLENISVIHDE